MRLQMCCNVRSPIREFEYNVLFEEQGVSKRVTANCLLSEQLIHNKLCNIRCNFYLAGVYQSSIDAVISKYLFFKHFKLKEGRQVKNNKGDD
jgi:hypothetical protein